MPRDEYTEIKIGNNVDLEDLKNNKTIEIDIEDFEVAEDDDTSSEIVIKEQDELEDEQPRRQANRPAYKKEFEGEKKKASRAETRIRQLNSSLKQEAAERLKLQQELEEARLEKQRLLEELENGSKMSAELTQATLDQTIQVLSKRMVEAIQNGEAEEVVKLQDQLFTAKSQLNEVKSIANKPKQTPTTKDTNPPAQQKQATHYDIPEKARAWVDEYPEFYVDPLFNSVSLKISDMLITEGYDGDTDEFYDELTERLAPRFPEIFGTQNKNKVNYNKKPSKDVKQRNYEDEQDFEDEDYEQPVRRPRTTVAGSSRSPRAPLATNNQQRRGRTSVVLTPDMVKNADKWGMSLEQMARRVAHIEKNKSKDGYVPIMIPD